MSWCKSKRDKFSGRLHFLCCKCGRGLRLPGSTVDLQLAARAPRSAREGHFEVQVRGICDECVDEDLILIGSLPTLVRQRAITTAVRR